MENEPRKKSTIIIKIAKIGYIFLSLTLCVLGAVRLTLPHFSADRFSVLCGIVFIAFGCVRILGFCSKDLYRLAFQYDLEFGILIILLGILTFIRPGSFTSMTCVLLGLLILADALFKIRITLDAKKFGIEQWWLLLIIALAASVLGGILVFYLGEKLNTIFGISMIVEGVLSLSTALALVKITKNQVE